MLDVLYIAIPIAFFVISILYVNGCERLLREAGDE